MYKDLTIDITKGIIDELNEKFKLRDEKSYQKRIDKMLNNFDIIMGHKLWKKYVESTIVIGYSDYKGEDIATILETTEFENEMFVYFLYKVVLELFEVTPIKLHIRVYSDRDFYKKKLYIDGLLKLHSIEHNGGIEKIINKLDSDFETIRFDGLKLHGNVKNITKNLLGYVKRNDYRWNTSEDVLDKNVKTLRPNQKKRVACPLCKNIKDVNYANKEHIFQYKNSKVIFNCNHEKSQFISRKKVSITVKKSELPKGVAPEDYVLYNWKYFSKKWLEENNHEEK